MQYAEYIDFNNVQIGNTLRYVNIDNGFGGTGDFITYEGQVTRITKECVFVNAGGKTSRLTRKQWYTRSVRIITPEQKWYETVKAEYDRIWDLVETRMHVAGDLNTAAWHAFIGAAENADLTVTEGMFKEDTADYYACVLGGFETMFNEYKGAGINPWTDPVPF